MLALERGSALKTLVQLVNSVAPRDEPAPGDLNPPEA
jgi:hypothetical protein